MFEIKRHSYSEAAWQKKHVAPIDSDQWRNRLSDIFDVRGSNRDTIPGTGIAPLHPEFWWGAACDNLRSFGTAVALTLPSLSELKMSGVNSNIIGYEGERMVFQNPDGSQRLISADDI